jgi:transposase
VTRLLRINWRTVGAIIERIVADELDPHRLEGLYEIGIDEVSYRKQHHYLTVVANHRTGKVVWTDEGKDTAAARRFYDALGCQRAHRLTAVSMDMGAAYPKVTAERAPRRSSAGIPSPSWRWPPASSTSSAAPTGTTCANRRCGHREAVQGRPLGAAHTTRRPHRRPGHVLAALCRVGGATWRAYQLKEALRAIFAEDLRYRDVSTLIDRWASWAQRSRIPGFIALARTIRERRDGILAAVGLGLANGRLEGLNNRVRLITRRGFGLHSAAAAALVMLTCGPITLNLPHEK